MKKNKTVYSAVFFDDKTRNDLQSLANDVFRSFFSNIKIHHITLCFGEDVFEYGKEVTFDVIGYVKDEKAQAFLIEMPIDVEKKLHITVSHTDEVKPFYSNELIETTKPFLFDSKKTFAGKIGRFTNKGIMYE